MAGKQKYTIEEATERLELYCAKEDRSFRQIQQRLFRWNIPYSEQDEIVMHLRSEGFLDESRFSEAFVRGKVRINQWGIEKIRKGLIQHKVSSYNIERALKTIDPETYENNLRSAFHKKYEQIPSETHFLKRKQKVVAFLQQKGYRYDEIARVWEENTQST